jgi:ribosomal protein S18 acetylase RimI-like enzyme
MDEVNIPEYGLRVRPISRNDRKAVLHVYRQCEDFLALGPAPIASMDMVRKDLELSRQAGGIFCGIYQAGGEMIGVFDYIPCNYQGVASQAFLELFMLASPYRSCGMGTAILRSMEKEISKGGRVRTILSGVQVNNPKAIRFWRKNGYRIVSEPKLHPDRTTAIDLRKDLP